MMAHDLRIGCVWLHGCYVQAVKGWAMEQKMPLESSTFYCRLSPAAGCRRAGVETATHITNALTTITIMIITITRCWLISLVTLSHRFTSAPSSAGLRHHVFLPLLPSPLRRLDCFFGSFSSSSHSQVEAGVNAQSARINAQAAGVQPVTTGVETSASRANPRIIWSLSYNF